MILGLDYNGTITARPNELRKLAKHFDKVIIISATSKPQEVRLGVKRLFFPYEVVTVENGNKAQNKLEACRKHSVNVYIDDEEYICSYLSKNGILALRMM